MISYLNILYDYYQSLLTEKERACFLDYYDRRSIDSDL